MKPAMLSEYLETTPKWAIALLGILIAIGLGGIDYLTGVEISFAIFYLIPVALVAWYVNKQAGIVLAIFSAMTWFGANWLLLKGTSSRLLIHEWNTVARLGFFLVVAIILAELRQSLEREKAASRKDFLTGAANPRAFSELAEMEFSRAQRHNRPLSIAYLDADNFKTVNDQWGHQTGDAALQVIAETLKANLRAHDIIARLGGDEFVILFPENGPEAALSACRKIRKKLLEEMASRGWPITFSIGLLTYLKLPDTVDEMVNQADHLMYTVKQADKNEIRHVVLPLSDI